MPFRPYDFAADALEILGQGGAASAARAGGRAQRSVEQISGRAGRTVAGGVKALAQSTGFNAHPTRGAIAGRGTTSLPGIRTAQGVTGQGRLTLGTNGADGTPITLPFVVPVGSPSIKVDAQADGSVITTLLYRSIYTPFISPADWNRIKQFLQKVLRRAKGLSRGRLGEKRLAQLNHPYGKGTVAPSGRRRRGLGRLTRLRGVSNLAVVNRQSGRFEASWVTMVKLIKTVGVATGVELVLANLSPVAAWLATGTRRMRAHGPFLTAFQLFKPQLDILWREVTRRAWMKSRRVVRA